MNALPAPVYLLVAVCILGCAPNTVYFSEGTVLGFRAEFKPDASEPVNSSLAYKRRIVTVVPPKNPNVASFSDWLSGTQNVQQGEALSVVSTFSVDASIKKITIENNFLSGMAAQKATQRDAVQTIQAVVSPETLAPLSDTVVQRQHALYEEIDKMDGERAKILAAKLQLTPTPATAKDAKFLLNKEVMKAQSSGPLDALENTFKGTP